MQDDVGDHETWLLDFVGDDATDKVRRSGSQSSHEFTERFLVGSRDSLGTTLLLLLTATTGAFFSWIDPGSPGFLQEWKGSLLVKGSNGGIDWILVLFEPIVDVVTDSTGVVMEFEVRVTLTLGFWTWLGESVGLTHVILVKFVLEGGVGSFWEHTFFFEDGKDTHWFFDQVEGGCQVHTEIDSGPVNTFLLVGFLFEDEHVVVEELLQFFVSEVDAQLFEGVKVENFETSNIQDTNEEVSWEGGGEGFVNVDTKPVEETFKDGLGEGTLGVGDLWASLTLGDEFSTDLDTWVTQVFQEVG